MSATLEDAILFRSVVGHVTPLAEQNRIAQAKPAIPTRVRSTRSLPGIADTLSDYETQPATESYLANGLSRMTLRKLRRSSIEDSLDLHGSPIDGARILLQHFIFSATQQQFRHVLIIHGKGTNSPGGEAVLRALTRNWLTQHPHVLAYCLAPPNLGGEGAVIILLKNNSRTD
ncbi:MAG: Smr/MutS family protein [Nitrosomonadales bacterium]|jgi:DNA-nicking Smr family endonuclease